QAEVNDVAGRENVPLLGAEILQEPPHGTAILLAVVRFDEARQTINGQHAAAEDIAVGHVELLTGLLIFTVLGRIGGDDRPFAGRFPFAADALVSDEFILVDTFLMQVARQIRPAALPLMILAEVGADFFLLRHAFILTGRANKEDPRKVARRSPS